MPETHTAGRSHTAARGRRSPFAAPTPHCRRAEAHTAADVSVVRLTLDYDRAPHVQCVHYHPPRKGFPPDSAGETSFLTCSGTALTEQHTRACLFYTGHTPTRHWHRASQRKKGSAEHPNRLQKFVTDTTESTTGVRGRFRLEARERAGTQSPSTLKMLHSLSRPDPTTSSTSKIFSSRKKRSSRHAYCIDFFGAGVVAIRPRRGLEDRWTVQHMRFPSLDDGEITLSLTLSMVIRVLK